MFGFAGLADGRFATDDRGQQGHRQKEQKPTSHGEESSVSEPKNKSHAEALRRRERNTKI